MTVEVEKETNAKSKFSELETEVPEDLSILPLGRDEQDSEMFVIFPDDSDTVQKLLKQAGIEFTEPANNDNSSTLVLHSEELLIPTLYAAYQFTKTNWSQIEFALQKISEYYSRQYNQEVEMSVEQETADGKTTRLTYRGPPEQLDELSEELSEIVGVEREVEDERER